MERESDNNNLAPVYKDILDRLERVIELQEAAQDTAATSVEWEFMYTNADAGGTLVGWEPFAVTSPSPGVHFVWWRRRRGP